MSKIVKILKKIKIKNLIILIFLLIFNTYAWFVFQTKASLGITAHVSAWKVDFMSEDGTVSKDIVITIDRIFPGMATFEKEIKAKNSGDAIATLEYEIESFRVIDESFSIEQGYTSAELNNKITNEYPFKTEFIIDDFGTISNSPELGKIRVKVTWPFESGDDAKDTLWGTKAYDFYDKNPEGKSIELKVKLIARQKN